jgi:electron transport complex protein RnfA
MEITKELIAVFIAMAFVNNFVFAKSIGLCPYLGVSKNFSSAIGMGIAVVFVMTLTSVVTWLVYRYILMPFHIEYLYIIAFILVIAALVQLVEMILEKTSPGLYYALGIYLPLITTNCAVLGIAVLNKDMFFTAAGPVTGSFLKSIINGVGGGVGFFIALLLMSGIRERIELCDVPESMKEIPIAFITAAIMSIAFMGFL